MRKNISYEFFVLKQASTKEKLFKHKYLTPFVKCYNHI